MPVGVFAGAHCHPELGHCKLLPKAVGGYSSVLSLAWLWGFLFEVHLMTNSEDRIWNYVCIVTIYTILLSSKTACVHTLEDAPISIPELSVKHWCH